MFDYCHLHGYNNYVDCRLYNIEGWGSGQVPQYKEVWKYLNYFNLVHANFRPENIYCGTLYSENIYCGTLY